MLTRGFHSVKKGKDESLGDSATTGNRAGVDAGLLGVEAFLDMVGEHWLDKRMGRTYDEPPRL